MSTLATDLINEHEAGRGRTTVERIELTDEQAKELRKGFAEGRGAWGRAETTIGKVRWDLLREKRWDTFRERVQECYILTYHLANPPVPKKSPNHAATSIATGYAMWSVKNQARFHLTASLTSYKDRQNKKYPVMVKLESWATTLDQKERTLKHWKSLKAINVQIEEVREPTEEETSQDAYYQLTGKRLPA